MKSVILQRHLVYSCAVLRSRRRRSASAGGGSRHVQNTSAADQRARYTRRVCVCVPNDADESKQTGGRGAASQRSEEEIVCALRNESRDLREWRESTVW